VGRVGQWSVAIAVGERKPTGGTSDPVKAVVRAHTMAALSSIVAGASGGSDGNLWCEGGDRLYLQRCPRRLEAARTDNTAGRRWPSLRQIHASPTDHVRPAPPARSAAAVESVVSDWLRVSSSVGWGVQLAMLRTTPSPVSVAGAGTRGTTSGMAEGGGGGVPHVGVTAGVAAAAAVATAATRRAGAMGSGWPDVAGEGRGGRPGKGSRHEAVYAMAMHRQAHSCELGDGQLWTFSHRGPIELSMDLRWAKKDRRWAFSCPSVIPSKDSPR